MAAVDATQPSITHASAEDVPEIMKMIRELAAYENAADKVQATETSLRHTLTFQGSTRQTNPGFAKTLLLRLPVKPANKDDVPEAVVGFAMYFNNYSTWRAKPGIYLEDLFVREEYRKRGYGKMLIQELAREVMRIDGARLEWSCLRNNTPTLEFYKSLGAREMEDWVQLRVDGKELEDLALGKTQGIQTGVQNDRTGQISAKEGQKKATPFIMGTY